jgi:hypothetical protein
VTRLREILGLPGLCGALLLAAAFAFLLAVLQPLEARRALLRAQATTADSSASRSDSGARSAPAQAKLAAFYGFFRRDTVVTDYLAQLYALAKQAGVEPRAAEYRLSEPGRVQLAEYSVSMPLRGGYGQIRAFLENALEQIPVLTLDHLSVRRNRVADQQIEAEVRFTLFIVQP